jgi:hypothetical protein
MTNCELLRQRVCAEPPAADAAFERHAETCAGCRAFRQRLLRTEALIGRALGFDVTRATAARRRPAGVTASWVSLGAGVAAAAIAGLTFWSIAGGSLRVPSTELAAAVVAHWAHEPDSLRRTDASVSFADLAEVMLGTAEMDMSALGAVSYASVCRVGGRIMPHLVVQGEAGPYMVLLLPGEALASPVPLASADGGLAGRIVPRGSGSIAVLGQAGAELDAMESMVADAVDWSLRP